MKTELLIQKRRDSRCGYYGRDLADNSQSRAIEVRADRRSFRQEMQRGAYLMVDDSADEGEE